MTQLQFNHNIDYLKEILMKSDLDDVIKASIVLVLNEFMEKERDEHLSQRLMKNRQNGLFHIYGFQIELE